MAAANRCARTRHKPAPTTAWRHTDSLCAHCISLRRRARLWRLFQRYFNAHAVGQVGHPGAQKQAIFCLYPHGIFPFGIAFASLTE